MNEPFIMESQAKQVFNVTDPSENILSIILQEKHIPLCDKKQDLNLDIPKTSFTTHVRKIIQMMCVIFIMIIKKEKLTSKCFLLFIYTFFFLQFISVFTCVPTNVMLTSVII